MKKGGKLVQQTLEYPLPIFFRTAPHQLSDSSVEEVVELLLERGVPYVIRRKEKEGLVLVKRNGNGSSKETSNGTSFPLRLSCLEDVMVDYKNYVRIVVDPPNLFVRWNGRRLFFYYSVAKQRYVVAPPVFHRMEPGEYWFKCGCDLEFCIQVPDVFPSAAPKQSS